MPTYERADSFKRDYKKLDSAEKSAVMRALQEFIEDLARAEATQVPQPMFRGSLRVKPMQGASGVWEMTWAGEDGRATFTYGMAITEGKFHVIWRRIGGHAIFADP